MVLKKKRFNNTITGGLEPKEFSYSIVRYNYVFIRSIDGLYLMLLNGLELEVEYAACLWNTRTYRLH